MIFLKRSLYTNGISRFGGNKHWDINYIATKTTEKQSTTHSIEVRTISTGERGCHENSRFYGNPCRISVNNLTRFFFVFKKTSLFRYGRQNTGFQHRHRYVDNARYLLRFAETIKN